MFCVVRMMSDVLCSDHVGFLVTEYLGVYPVQLQHQSVNQFSFHPLV